MYLINALPMKNYIIVATLLFLGCGESKEKRELDRLRDSIRIIHSLKWSDPSVFDPSMFPNANGRASREDIERMEENAKRTADSIADAISNSNVE